MRWRDKGWRKQSSSLRLGFLAALLASWLSPTGELLAGPIGPPIPAASVAAKPAGFWGGAAYVCRRVKLKCQSSNVGKLLTNAIRPVSKLTGGLIPVPNDNHFAGAVELHAAKPAGMAPGAAPKPPPPPPPGVAAAAMIKAEKQQAAIRREAVAYLAGLDCRYYPEAESALIASLRADRDECVRLEAARALLTGCCCTPAVVKALTVTVTGSCADGNPAERSPAVRQVALAALHKCQACCAGGPDPAATPPEAPLGALALPDSLTPVSYTGAPIALRSESTPANTIEPSDLDAKAPSTRSLLDLWHAAGELSKRSQ